MHVQYLIATNFLEHLMTVSDIAKERFGKLFLVLLAIGISIVFLLMIRGFLVALLLAGVFTAMAQPLYRWALLLTRKREAPAAFLTVLAVLILIVGPATGFLTIVVSQAVNVSEAAGPWINQQLSQPDELDKLLERLPFADRILPYQDQIAAKIGEVAQSVGGFLVGRLAAASRGTMSFLLSLFVMLYAMFFFLRTGRATLDKILYYMPLDSDAENRMVVKFVSVSRATLKGTLVIGVMQGALGGVALWVAGIGTPVFWGTVMAVLSIIPGIGPALVWIPATIYLVVVGQLGAAIAFAIWCAAVVGTVDNVLRPRLVGKDTQMPDLLILVSTLGGLILFGAVGIIIGPVVAALFVTVWDIYGEALKAYLPEVKPLG